MALKAKGEWIIVRPDDEIERSIGGIYLPDIAKERPRTGKVLSIGEHVDLVGTGERIVFGRYAGTEIVDPADGTGFLILSEKDVLAGIID